MATASTIQVTVHARTWPLVLLLRLLRPFVRIIGTERAWAIAMAGAPHLVWIRIEQGRWRQLGRAR